MNAIQPVREDTFGLGLCTVGGAGVCAAGAERPAQPTVAFLPGAG